MTIISKIGEVAFTGITQGFESGYMVFALGNMVGLYVVNGLDVAVPVTLKSAGNLFDNLGFYRDGKNFYSVEVNKVGFTLILLTYRIV